jgi:hypothetical protein
VSSESGQWKIDVLLLDFATEWKGKCLFDELRASSSTERTESSVALITVLRITICIKDYIILMDVSFGSTGKGPVN